MKPYSTLWTYLWDLVDDGIEESVHFLKQEVRLDAISVATAYHTFQQLRPQRPGRKLLISNTAAVYFQPDLSLYQDSCLRPYVAPLARQANPLARLANSCAAAGLDLISWTVCLHNSFLAENYPRCAAQTAYGDNLSGSLCPGVDDVRAYIVALCRDLVANYGVKRLELESCDFVGYGHAHYHIKDGVNLGSIGHYLYGLSFSEGCVQKARDRGIDVDGLRAWVRQQLDPAFASGIPIEGNLQAFLDSHSDLAAFQEMRQELVVSLVRQIKEATGVEVAFMGGGRRIAEVADLLEILAYTPLPDQVGAQISDALQHLDSAERLVVGLQAYYPCANTSEELEANVHRALALGIRQFSYYNYGIMPRPNFQWIRRCIEKGEGLSDG
ncbi:MAG: hypothetical protein EXS58_01445 [Candidatus Latescibacteria bacterium]|nr:hypothetical protein [Candidatus Latescibacterota bacterium]